MASPFIAVVFIPFDGNVPSQQSDSRPHIEHRISILDRDIWVAVVVKGSRLI
jgi:hypothetical protein